ncbi:MAG TPA: hypothetical protein VL201_05065 [Patescibacteria group bacterium]|jgi:hypothetical protein|nr:hypothetical protein [Patescibacteria group bacterium]
MKYALIVLGLLLWIQLQTMELINITDFTKKYESSEPEKFSIVAPDIKKLLSQYNRVSQLKGDSWIPIFKQYSIDPFTAVYVLYSIRGDMIFPKEVWCYIFQFLKFDRDLGTFALQDMHCKFIGYLCEKQLREKVFSFKDFDIKMKIGNDVNAKLVVKNKEVFLEDVVGGYEEKVLTTKTLTETLKNSRLISNNVTFNFDTNFDDDHDQLYGVDIDNLKLTWCYTNLLCKPCFFTSFIEKDITKYQKEIDVEIDENYSKTIQFPDYVRSSYACIEKNTENIWLIVETIDDNICFTDEGAHHDSLLPFPSKHYMHILKVTRCGLFLQKMTRIILPLLQLDMNKKPTQVFANTRFSVTDVIDGNILVYDSLKKLYCCFELFK